MIPGRLKSFMTFDEESKVLGPLTPVRPRASPNRGNPLYAKKMVDMNRYILCLSPQQVPRSKIRSLHEENEMPFVVQPHALIDP